MQFKINNKTWEIKEISQEEIKQEMKKHFEEPETEGRINGGENYVCKFKKFNEK